MTVHYYDFSLQSSLSSADGEQVLSPDNCLSLVAESLWRAADQESLLQWVTEELSEPERDYIESLDWHGLTRQARILRNKRWKMVRSLIPRTIDLLAELAQQRFFEYYRHCQLPPGRLIHHRDAYRFLTWIKQDTPIFQSEYYFLKHLIYDKRCSINLFKEPSLGMLLNWRCQLIVKPKGARARRVLLDL